MTARVYVPATRARVARWHTDAAVPADAERVLASADDEDSEYDALMTAAAMAVDLRPEDGRRVVVVVETEDPAGDGSLPVRHWVAVHCDVADRPVDADPDDDLAWFGVQEIPDLLRAAPPH